MAESIGFSHSWRAEVLTRPPVIAPVRSFVYPQRVVGEDEAMARGALSVLVRPRTGGQYLLTCALGFTAPSLPTGLFACPNPDHLCAVAGGYAYLSDTTVPETCTLLTMKPVVEVMPAESALLFVGFHTVLAWGADGLLWESARLTSEGIRVTRVVDGRLEGFGWDMRTDREMAFSVDLATGENTGGVPMSGSAMGPGGRFHSSR